MQCIKSRSIVGASVFMLLTLLECAEMQGTVQDAPDNGVCQSQYINQPPDQLQCDPYINGELLLDCTVRQIQAGSETTVIPIVDWFYRNSLLSDVEKGNGYEAQWDIAMLNNSQNITIRQQMLRVDSDLRVRSRLEVYNLDKANVGQYWCRIRSHSAEHFIPSDSVFLLNPSEYTLHPPCSTRVAQRKSERKCALWEVGFTAPQNTPLSTTVSTVVPQQPVTGGSSPLTTLSGDSSLLYETTGEEIPANPSPDDNDDDDDDDDKKYLMKFYIAIAILGAIVTVLIPTMIGLCIKYGRVNKGRNKISQQRVSTGVIQSPSIQAATEYLVPMHGESLTEPQSEHCTLQSIQNSNLVYMTDVRQDSTTFWFQQQQRPQMFEHSYETTHDYEDIFQESLNEGTPVLMKSNEAYGSTLHPQILPLS